MTNLENDKKALHKSPAECSGVSSRKDREPALIDNLALNSDDLRLEGAGFVGECRPSSAAS